LENPSLQKADVFTGEEWREVLSNFKLALLNNNARRYFQSEFDNFEESFTKYTLEVWGWSEVDEKSASGEKSND